MTLVGLLDLSAAFVLGLVQGLTEFLPVSSSGHLVLVAEAFGYQTPGALPEIAVHVGTLGSVLVYFAKDLLRVARDVVGGGPGRRTVWMVVVATIPAVVVGLALKPLFESLFESPVAAACGLLVTGTVLLLTPLARTSDKDRGVGYSVLVGLAQAIAIFPGISRSGSTISAALFLGENPEEAARFSFLLAIPTIGGAAVLTAADVISEGTVPAYWVNLCVAAAVAFGTGLVAIWALMGIVRRGRLAAFGPYCLLVGVGSLLWLLSR